MLLTASCACIIRMFLDGVFSDSSWMEPRQLAAKMIPSIRSSGSQGPGTGEKLSHSVSLHGSNQTHRPEYQHLWPAGHKNTFSLTYVALPPSDPQHWRTTELCDRSVSFSSFPSRFQLFKPNPGCSALVILSVAKVPDDWETSPEQYQCISLAVKHFFREEGRKLQHLPKPVRNTYWESQDFTRSDSWHFRSHCISSLTEQIEALR